MDEIMKKLQAPFTPDEIEWRVGSTNQDKTKGLALAYVTNRAIQNRLDEVFGVFGWKNEYKEWKGSSQICGISVKYKDEWITKWDGSDDSNTEATKGGLSDAMKRAGYQWGIGRYLYKLPQVWCAITPCGKSFKLVAEPALPKWALPEGVTEDKKPQPQLAPTAVQQPLKAQTQTTVTNGHIEGAASMPTYTCQGCKVPISKAVHEYSTKNHKKSLCQKCQKLSAIAI